MKTCPTGSGRGIQSCAEAPEARSAWPENAPAFVNYSTCSRPKSVRLDYWNELVGGIFPGMTVSADQGISAQWTHFGLGTLALARALFPKAQLHRWADTSPTEPTNRVAILLKHAGSSLIEQRREAAVIGRGDMTLCFSDEQSRIGVSDRSQCFVVECPVAALADSAGDLDQHIARTIGRHLRPVRLLRNFLNSLFHQHWPAAPDPQEANALGSVVVTLLRCCIASGPLPPDGPDEGTRARVLRFVEEHLFDSGLRTGIVANRLSISVRSVQNVFAELATTPTAFVLERRLVAAAEAIKRRPGFSSVADLAFELGFGNASYFARKFKTRFRVSPSEYAHRCANVP